MAAPRRTRRFPSGSGAITWVGLALLAAVVGGGYLAWVWGPVYLTHYEVKQVVRRIGNEAVKSTDDAQLRDRLVERLRAVGQVEDEGPDGRPTTRPLVDVKAQDISWERVAPDALRVAFDYEREIVYPLLDRSTTQVMTVDLTMDVSRPVWNSNR